MGVSYFNNIWVTRHSLTETRGFIVNIDKACLKCDHKIKQGANFCEKCGGRIKKESNLRKEFLYTMKTIRSLTNVTQADFDLLREVASETSEWKDLVVKTFYDILFGEANTALIFGKGERATREKTLGNWYLDLFKIEDEEAFWDMQVRVAFYHVRRKVYNEFMVSAGSRLEEIFMKNSVKTFGAERGVDVSVAFNRVLDTVVGITVALYDKIIQETSNMSQEEVDCMVGFRINDIEKNYLDGLVSEKK